jgi:hypothetical protein
MNGWAFGPDDLSDFIMPLRAGSRFDGAGDFSGGLDS